MVESLSNAKIKRGKKKHGMTRASFWEGKKRGRKEVNHEKKSDDTMSGKGPFCKRSLEYPNRLRGKLLIE